MPRESIAAKSSRLGRILITLRGAYPDAHCELGHADPLQLLVATILSAQCTDKQVNTVTPGLFNKYRSAADYAAAPPAEFEQDIRRIGLFRTKAKNIQAACRMMAQHHGGEVPRSMGALLELPGVGRKTANVVLGNAFGINEGIVVDTHVARLSARLRLASSSSPELIEKALMKIVPRDLWAQLSHWLIWHGRRRCGARRPDCAGCELRVLCPSAA